MAHQQPHSGAARQAAGILRSLTAGSPLCIERLAGQAAAGCSSLELERQELLESIVESLNGSRPPARTGATVALLRHLAGGGLTGPDPGRANSH
jgi:hypothetical protein